MKTTKEQARTRRHARIRATIKGTAERPRLAVYRSNKFISAQLINDDEGKTLAQAHGREFKGSPSEQATAVGKAIAERAKNLSVSSAVFDRGGYQYAAQIKALADAAREGGLTF